MNKQAWKNVSIITLVFSAVLMGPGNTAAAANTPQPQAKPKVTGGATKPTQVVPILRQKQEAWRKSMVRSKRPKKGCFIASYPSTAWKEVQCETPELIPFGPRKGVRPFTVGNGVDFSAKVTGNTSAAEGSFENVAGVTGVTGGGVPDKYSLQLNTNTFSTATCAGAANPGACQGWEQFIYSSKTIGKVFIQYWLLTYNNPCPGGWMSDGAGDCLINNAMGTPVPVQTINSANMNQMTLTGDVTDQVTLTVGGTIFSSPGDNHFPDLTNGWRDSEFNIFGDSAGTPVAALNAGSTMDVRARVNSGMGAIPPTCDGQGFTFEQNNLTLVGAPAMINDVNWPSIVFTQTNNPGTPSSCDNADAIGDTHLTTFGGLYYDFQAQGDFVLAEAGSDFQVQTRQISGAPNWPNASINKGVVAQLGQSRISYFIEPSQLAVDGRNENLADGKDLLLPTGVQISRRGNEYTVTSESGNRVRIVDNSLWMDVHVGLGHSPDPLPRGLLGFPKGSRGKALVTAAGTVMLAPVAFNDLYHAYAESWLVDPNHSLFREAVAIKPSIPTSTFFAGNLNRQDFARARAICVANHITNKTLLDSCTIDTTVLNEKAATVFVTKRAPIRVIKPVLRKPVDHVNR